MLGVYKLVKDGKETTKRQPSGKGNPRRRSKVDIGTDSADNKSGEQI